MSRKYIVGYWVYDKIIIESGGEWPESMNLEEARKYCGAISDVDGRVFELIEVKGEER